MRSSNNSFIASVIVFTSFARPSSSVVQFLLGRLCVGSWYLVLGTCLFGFCSRVRCLGVGSALCSLCGGALVFTGSALCMLYVGFLS